MGFLWEKLHPKKQDHSHVIQVRDRREDEVHLFLPYPWLKSPKNAFQGSYLAGSQLTKILGKYDTGALHNKQQRKEQGLIQGFMSKQMLEKHGKYSRRLVVQDSWKQLKKQLNIIPKTQMDEWMSDV